MSRQTRRAFLKKTAAATAGVAAGLTLAGTKASGTVLGANDTIRVAVAGIKGRGQSRIGAFADMDKVQVTHLVDPDSSLFESRAASVKSRGGNTPKCVQHIRQALDDKDLDVVSVATCNHWHSLITIWACQARKDVYVEKPCSHNPFEGRKCVEAARRYNCIVQHGTQQRSSQWRANQMAAIRSGKYGRLLVSKGYCCKPRWSIKFQEPKDPPPELDFNLWLGPAPEQPYHENLVHYNWHWFWDFGNGDMGNQGVHEMDLARWAIKDGTLPTSVWGLGGRWVDGPEFKDQGQTPNMELCVFDYGETLIVFETRGLVGKHKGFAPKVTNEFYTTEGLLKDGKFHPHNGGKTHDVEVEPIRVTPGKEFGSFIRCVRSRRRQEVNGEIEEAHYSAALCHLGNISYRLGEQVPFSQRPPGMDDNRQVAESFETIKGNLEAIGVDLSKATYQLGPVLKFDPGAEKFIGNDAANKLLTRDYRPPFVVPEEV